MSIAANSSNTTPTTGQTIQQNQANATANAAQSMASLYVGDLNPDVSEATLYEKFAQYGSVLSIRVCRDIVTKKSLGYAYVNFTQVADAERAIEALNFEPINGRPIRIMWSQRDPSVRRSGVGNVFMKNLDKEIDNRAIYDTFSRFGHILSCKVATDEAGVSKGFAFVHFDSEAAAQHCIDNVHGVAINGKPVYIARFIPKQERERPASAAKFNNLYIKNIDENIDDDQLKEKFGKHGEIISAKVVYDDATKKSKCFGFVSFAKAESAQSAVDEWHDKEVEGLCKPGFSLYCQRAQKKSEREAENKKKALEAKKIRHQARQNSNLYVKNLDEEFNDDMLREQFSKYGAVESAKVMVDEKGLSKLFGFVLFSNPEEAANAIKDMNGRIIFKKPLYVAPFMPKQERERVVTQNLNNRFAFNPVPPMQFYNTHNPYVAFPVPQYTPRYPNQMPNPQLVRNNNQQNQMMWNRQMRPQQGGYGMQNRGPNQYNNRQRQVGGQQQQQQQPQTPQQPSQIAQRPDLVNATMRTNQSKTGQMQNGPSQMTQPAKQSVGQPVPQPAAVSRRAQPAAPAKAPTNDAGADFAARLAKMPQDEAKNVLGERLYPLVEQSCNDTALHGKITGMLLESMEPHDLVVLLDPTGHDTLESKVTEAYNMLKSGDQ